MGVGHDVMCTLTLSTCKCQYRRSRPRHWHETVMELGAHHQLLVVCEKHAPRCCGTLSNEPHSMNVRLQVHRV